MAAAILEEPFGFSGPSSAFSPFSLHASYGLEPTRKPQAPQWDLLPPRALAMLSGMLNQDPDLCLVCKGWSGASTLDSQLTRATTFLRSSEPLPSLPHRCVDSLSNITLVMPTGLTREPHSSPVMTPVVFGPADTRELGAAILRLELSLLKQSGRARALASPPHDPAPCILQLVLTGTILHEKQVAEALRVSSGLSSRDWQVQLNLLPDQSTLSSSINCYPKACSAEPASRVRWLMARSESVSQLVEAASQHIQASGYVVLDGSLRNNLTCCSRVAGLHIPSRDVCSVMPAISAASCAPTATPSAGGVTAHVTPAAINITASEAHSECSKPQSCVSFPRLTQLTLVDVSDEWTSTWQHLLTPAVLPNLTHLHISTQKGKPVQLCQPICMPSLECVIIAGAGVCFQGRSVTADELLLQP